MLFFHFPFLFILAWEKNTFTTNEMSNIIYIVSYPDEPTEQFLMHKQRKASTLPQPYNLLIPIEKVKLDTRECSRKTTYTASISSHVMVSKSRICRSFKRVLFASCPPKITKVPPTRVTDWPPRDTYKVYKIEGN